jgi:hypothetical protein
MQKKVQYLSGDFEGYFYTNQKVTLSQSDHLPTDGAHKMVLYNLIPKMYVAEIMSI